MAELMNETWEEEGAEGCPECGAPAGEECAQGCPNEGRPGGADPAAAHDRRFEGVDRHFDKFMGRILAENNRPRIPTAGDSLQRVRAARVQDRPLNKIRMGGPR